MMMNTSDKIPNLQPGFDGMIFAKKCANDIFISHWLNNVVVIS